MLTISPIAAEAIRGMLATLHPASDTGVRISASQRPPEGRGRAYDLSVSDSPAPGDCVVRVEGLELYVEPDAAPALEDKLLDARIERGALRFALLSRS